MSGRGPTFLTPKEVATFLGFREGRVRSLLRKRILPGKKIDRSWLTEKSKLIKFLDCDT